MKIQAPKNHPRQTQSRPNSPTLFGTSLTDEVDDRETPWKLFRELDEEFHFTIDVAASKDNAKCQRFYDLEANGLLQDWGEEVVWCNPPYSDLAPWIAKASIETKARIVMLLPANRTEQPFWQNYVEPYRDKYTELTIGLSTRFIPGRLRFGNPGLKPTTGGVPLGSVLLIWW